MLGCLTWRQDPGPCPICGVPHTACTAETAAALTVPLSRPRVLDRAVTPPVQAVADTSFTTATYRRAVHGRKRRGGQ